MTIQPYRDLGTIAREIAADWRKVYFGAKPYLEAMGTMSTVDQAYGADSGRSVVRYFLVNAQTWRGDTARRVKAELKHLVGDAC